MDSARERPEAGESGTALGDAGATYAEVGGYK
jgi:hypothetical protein